ncbi:hypothetical protein EMIT0324P_20143 [Pseudomonas chlororaphis]
MSVFSCNGGCAWETFGSAGFLYLRFISLRTAATLSPDNEHGSSLFDMGGSTMYARNLSVFCCLSLRLHPLNNTRFLAVAGGAL